jgi:hypothetical protein
MLGRHEYDCAAGRKDLFAGPPFARKIVLTKRPRWSEPEAQFRVVRMGLALRRADDVA